MKRPKKYGLIYAIGPKIGQKRLMKAEKITPYFSHKAKNKPKSDGPRERSSRALTVGRKEWLILAIRPKLSQKKHQWARWAFVCARSYSRPKINSRIFRRLNKLRLILGTRPKISQKRAPKGRVNLHSHTLLQ